MVIGKYDIDDDGQDRKDNADDGDGVVEDDYDDDEDADDDVVDGDVEENDDDVEEDDENEKMDDDDDVVEDKMDDDDVEQQVRASTACSRLQLCNSLNSASATKPSLFCSFLHCFVLFCAVLCCFALFCTVLHCCWCFVLFALYSAVCTVCIVLNCVAKCSAQFCNVFPPLNLHCSALRRHRLVI